ncbi:hypothetical protein PHYBOEH_000514 [Phytophthora boehmeriae]|uniref:Uncharacterized protein n=1 Tax=Phytophthora boehmeriae TaxID=109152 RepID=A0A8T1WWN2_9STRA|nr:hypothetical protein PHYBOEH_000514 [Phytophthora boehmeriae]
MADESDVFEDCGSDFEEDEGDWAFTDGASASVLQLIGGASPARSAAAEQQPPAGQGESKSTQQTADDKHSDDDLLNELFPEKNIETTDELKQRQSDGGDRRASECEVEWALMALEEHDQLGRSRSEATTPRDGNDPASLFEEMYGGDTVIALSTPPHPSKAAIARSGIKQQSRIVEEKRDTSPKHIEVAAPSRRDEEYFVSLFEEMYGGDAAISLSTPPPPTQATAARSDTKQQQRRAEEKIDTPLKHVDAASSPARNRSGADDVEGVTVKPDEPPPDSPKTFIEDTPEMIIPVEILHMLRLVHNAATTGGVAILPLKKAFVRKSLFSRSLLPVKNDLNSSLLPSMIRFVFFVQTIALNGPRQ